MSVPDVRPPLPTHDALAAETAAILARLGVTELPHDGDLAARTPITGGELAAAARAHGRRGRRHRRRGAGRLPRVAHGAGAGARRARPRARRAAARAQGRPRRARLDRGRQDPLRGPGRGAGDDRHLRSRRRPVAPAARPDHRLRAPRPPDDGAVAPARGRRRHQRLQLPGRGVVVERRARLRLRRRGGVEAVGEDAADRARLPGAGRRGRPPRRRARPPISAVVLGGAEVGEALVDDHARRAAQRDRLDPDGPRRRPARGRPLRPPAARARRQQRRDRRAVGRPRPHRARHRVLRRRHRRPALHVAAPRHRALVDRRRARRPARRRLRARCRSARRWTPARSSARWSTRRPTRATRRRWRRRRPTAASCWPAARACWPTTPPDAYYVQPALVRMPTQSEIVQAETFAPILYVMTYDSTSTRRSQMHNDVPQGLSSSIFTMNVREAERFVVRRRLGLRHRQRQHRPVRRRDRRRVRRREGDRRRARVRLGRLEVLHAARHQHRQLLDRAAAGPGRRVRLRVTGAAVTRRSRGHLPVAGRRSFRGGTVAMTDTPPRKATRCLHRAPAAPPSA